MKKLIISLLLCLILAVGASAASVDALYITCDVRSDGSAEYSVAVSARFDSSEKKFIIPLAGENISNVSGSGNWSLVTDGGWARVELRNNNGFIGRQTFVVTYRAGAPEIGGSENDNMDLPLVGSRWETNAAEFSFDVTMPTPLETAPMLVSGYSGEMLGLISLTSTGFSGVIEDGLMAHEALTVEMSLPEGYFEHARLRNFLALDWGLILLAVLIVLCVLYWICTLRSRRPVVQPRVLPPEGWTPGELAAILGTEPNMAAQVLQWGQLGYLYVDHAGGELVLGLGMAMGSERPAHETRMFAHIFSGRREFWMPDRAFQQATAQASQAASRIWRARMFDRRGGNPHLLRIVSAIAAGMATAAAVAALLPVGAGWTILAFLTFIPGTALGLLAQLAVGELRRHPSPRWQVLPGLAALALLLMMGSARVLYAVPALLLQIFVGWQLAYGGRRSAAGVEALGQFLSLRRFLLQASPKRLQQMLQRDPTWLQSVLPYAAQMGLLERLSRTLGSTRVEEPVWLRTDEPLTTASACCNAYKQLLRGLTKEK